MMQKLLPPHLVPTLSPAPLSRAVAQFHRLRVTVLSPLLLRIEYSPTTTYEDRATQMIWHRNHYAPHDLFHEGNSKWNLRTDRLLLSYTETEKLNPDSLSIKLLTGNQQVWKFGQENKRNLKGTIRTLDGTDGAVPLEPGLLSRDGWHVLDDSNSLILENGWPIPRCREDGYFDFYFFGYGTDYTACLQDFRKVSGQVPLIPKFVLGNWWSRFWAYSQQDICDLIDKFEEVDIPLSVFIIDMDWHITKTDEKDNLWTGFTWDKKLFPDYRKLISYIHQKKLRTALNLHPADGIHPHEEQYEAFSQQYFQEKQEENTEVGGALVPKAPIPFNITDINFLVLFFN